MRGAVLGAARTPAGILAVDSNVPWPKGSAAKLKGMLIAGTMLVAVTAGTAGCGSTTHTAAVTTQCSTSFFDGDARLGPQTLPASGPVAPIVKGYRRLAGLTKSKFLATYWDRTANNGNGGWRYPPDNGFLIWFGHPVEFPLTLQPGQQVDRFGKESGGFLAPKGTLYAARALPPANLDDFAPAFTCDYHLYQVVRPFSVEAGLTAADFGQTGMGLQYQLVQSLVSGAPRNLDVAWLISKGYLRRLN